MKIFVVLRTSYCEGNFGDTESDSSIFCGAYTSLEKAQEAIEILPKPRFIDFGYGGANEEYLIIQTELNMITKLKGYEDECPQICIPYKK